MSSEYDFFQTMGIILENNSGMETDLEEIMYDDSSFADLAESYDP